VRRADGSVVDVDLTSELKRAATERDDDDSGAEEGSDDD